MIRVQKKELLLIENGIWKLCTPSGIQTKIIQMDPSQCRLSKHVSPVCEATDWHSSRSFRKQLLKTVTNILRTQLRTQIKMVQVG